MKILLTGKSDFSYNRTQVLIAGLQAREDIELVYYPISKSFRKETFTKLSSTCDLVYIPPFRHSDVGFIKRHSKAPVVFDALISKYLTRTIDHGKWWTAWEKTWRDKQAFGPADVLLMDTEAHRRYVIDRYDLDESKVFSLPVGVDTSLFKPQTSTTDQFKFKVGFYGGFIPLQGVDKIVQAAEVLKGYDDIEFEIIGDGPTFSKVTGLARKLGLSNIKFSGRVPYHELNERINTFDLCLGVFGDSLKADLVIPNKVYHYAALRKCIITKDTVGIREVFKSQQNIVLVQNTPEAMAGAILNLKNNSSQLDTVSGSAYNLIASEYNQSKIAECFLRLSALAKDTRDK